MTTPAGGSPFTPGIIERVAAGIRYIGTGQAPAWFGPERPMAPQAPDSVKGRPWDFPVGFNLDATPGREGVNDGIADFALLRRVSDPLQGGLDMLRGAIETRKDQMEGQKWVIKGRDGKDGGQKAKDIMKALRRPDLVHTYRQWARPLWDDLLVIDAPALYFRPMPKGLFLPEVVDGATIKILVDANGRTPLPPDSAYQQNLKGLPAVNFTLEELLYVPRNLRSYRFYGMSPVEQVLGIVNIALKRQLHLLNYYTEGTVPDAVVQPPTDWGPDQIKAAQAWLDQLTASGTKRKVRIMPGGSFTETKAAILKDELDDWLARIICWVFNLAPGALVKDMNRATAGTNAQTAHEEGLEPLKLWWKDVMDCIIAKCWGADADDLEFAYQDEEITDANVKMTIWTGYKNAGVVTADEVRDKALGLSAMTDAQKEEVKPPPPMNLGAPVKPGEPGAGTPQGEEGGSASSLPPAAKTAHDHGLQKKKVVLKPLDRDRSAIEAGRGVIEDLFKSRFEVQKKALVQALAHQSQKLAKMSENEFDEFWDSLTEEGREEFRQQMAEALQAIGKDGASEALDQVLSVAPAGEKDLEAMLAQANERAVDFAEDRAAELVGMKWDEDAGAYIENPNAQWAIDETTREEIRDLAAKGMDEGWSNDQLADAIAEAEGFSDARAEMIARTETAFADVQGNMAGYEASGVVDATEWITGEEDCDICQENSDAGPVPLGGTYPSGDEMPPAHPNCRCDVLPVLSQADGD